MSTPLQHHQLRSSVDPQTRHWLACALEVEPRRCLASLPEAATRGCAFYASRDGWSLEGLGEAAVLTAEGRGRFQKMQVAARQLFRQLRPAGDGQSMPLRLVGGFAFAADGGGSDAWKALGAARWVLPEVGLLHTESASLLFAVAPAGLSADEAGPWLRRRLGEIREALRQPPGPVPVVQADLVGDTHEAFEKRVEQVLDRIRSGGVHKVTLATTESWSAGQESFEPTHVLEALREHFGGCFRFWIQPPGGPVFLGASPERLATVSGNHLRTEALAGTVACSGDEQRDGALAAWLQGSPKNRREHEVVVRFIRERLANISLRLEAPTEPEILRLKNVQHLHTPMEARLDPDIAPRGLFGVAERLHPTPAVAGLPAEGAMEVLRQCGESDRGWYAGAVGVIDAAGDGELCVGIRTALVTSETTTLFAGAGVVSGSDPAQERVETQHKLRAMQEVLCG